MNEKELYPLVTVGRMDEKIRILREVGWTREPRIQHIS